MGNINFILVFLVGFLNFVYSNDVLGCGGFIKSHVPIDFSKIEVKLVTKQGIIKDKTNCAPNNGYYFVPLYDKGELILELSPPPGWSFKPREVHLVIDGKDDCSQGRDINFVFEGFGITGRVDSLGVEKGGPKGVNVELVSKEGTRTTVTDDSGDFFFTPVFPGSYSVSISHPKWKIYKKSVQVTVTEGNTEIPPKSLIIQGYDVKGRITSEGTPVKDTTIVLYKKDEGSNVLVDGCVKEQLADLQFKNKYVCYVKSNSQGEFIFPSVPNGDYFVLPYYKQQNIYYQPDLLEFTVSHDSVIIPNSFEVVGFGIPGNVLNGNKAPITNAKVFLNGQEVGKTDSNGSYKLEKIKAGTYKLRAEADDLIFEEIVLNISPNSQKLPDLVPSAFKVCGTVTSTKTQTVTFSQVGSTRFIQTETDPQGKFCQFLSPGKYDVQVIVGGEDKQKGLQFFPLKQTIEVLSDKISDLLFSQLKAKISGKVKCIKDSDCDNLNIILKSATDEITLPIKNSAYSVSDMHPGTYDVSISSNKLCWKSSKQIVNVNSDIVEIPAFVQSGYSVTFSSSHDAKVTFVTPKQTKLLEYAVVTGISSYCLENPGEYSFTIESCHIYENNVIQYNTHSENNQIVLNALKHSTKVSIGSSDNYGNLEVIVSIGKEEKLKNIQYINGKYELELILGPSETAVIKPVSDTLYFVPPTVQIEGGNDCENLGTKINAIKGEVFQGKIQPSLPGVIITVQSEDGQEWTTESDSTGSYKFPPLANDKKYKLSAAKDSYVFASPDNNGNFKAHKLAEIVVTVVDGADESTLQGVLLSLSGGESYRRNLQTNDNGNISFTSLSPGEYFLRPMMKEYKFEPNSIIIPVKEGETVNVKLTGKRVAYSAFGTVTSLNGEPVENMVVVAKGVNNCSEYSEEATSDTTGHFRIRGLHLYCSYVVKVQLDNSDQVERTAPLSINVESVRTDVTKLSFIVFRPIAKTDVLVKVYAESVDHYKSLKVKLYRDADSDTASLIYTGSVESASAKVSKDRNTGVLVSLPYIPRDNRTYSVQLESVQNLKYSPEIAYFTANTSVKHIQLNFVLKTTLAEQPIKQTSVLTIVFIFVLLVGVYNAQIIVDLTKEHFNFNLNSLNSFVPALNNTKPTVEYYDNADIDKIVQSINSVKRKSKKTN